ncbi:hypothetical protein TraAM80_04633 [Trypanosoma rangeli]|uniref:Uncharacterized protein n=1 Tax=Trypanosoma rangeli TaxID=5698 RepID=A0A3R7MGI8_TRYRA|nr:uncharacterized protein TraAM80_04630 [Trypanosoma rangeli]XP_029238682.1 uncharacterized protein TraAM80_04633 [Trypanosoma rangeli]RNF05420.1 hypothetical protein TraAM80_04630 [Trypanosoma rangeli]RNF05423.1 hypothetical protein TraAM80_04633 [Trypanosoma rangeli]|eukprot:RNF05420.1 hypothetical protein TraAM80_04630 [Trypanosoma rangeli]
MTVAWVSSHKSMKRVVLGTRRMRNACEMGGPIPYSCDENDVSASESITGDEFDRKHESLHSDSRNPRPLHLTQASTGGTLATACFRQEAMRHKWIADTENFTCLRTPFFSFTL